MDGRIQIVGAVIVLLVCLVQYGESGECCKAHYSILASEVSNEQRWCSNYCCFSLLTYDCCDNILLQAPADMRMDTCAAMFSAYWYIILLVILGILGGIITCCICCCCACCRNRSHGTVFVPAQPNSMMIVTHQQPQPNDQSSDQSNAFNTGYNQ